MTTKSITFYDGRKLTFLAAGSRVTVTYFDARTRDTEEATGVVVEEPSFYTPYYGVRFACPVTGTEAVQVCSLSSVAAVVR